MNPIFFLDGKYLPADKRVLDAFPPGRMKGCGVFETIRAVHGKVELLDEHVQRLLRGLKALKIHHRYTSAGVKSIVRQVVRRNSSIILGRVRMMVFVQGRHVHCTAMVLPYRLPSAKQYRVGL